MAACLSLLGSGVAAAGAKETVGCGDAAACSGGGATGAAARARERTRAKGLIAGRRAVVAIVKISLLLLLLLSAVVGQWGRIGGGESAWVGGCFVGHERMDGLLLPDRVGCLHIIQNDNQWKKISTFGKNDRTNGCGGGRPQKGDLMGRPRPSCTLRPRPPDLLTGGRGEIERPLHRSARVCRAAPPPSLVALAL